MMRSNTERESSSDSTIERNYIRFYQHNVHGFQSKKGLIEDRLRVNHLPHICALQECTRSVQSAQHMRCLPNHYQQHVSETGRAILLIRNEVTHEAIHIDYPPQLESDSSSHEPQSKYERYGYESVWIKIKQQGQSTQPICICSFYRNPSPTLTDFDLDTWQEEINQIKSSHSHKLIICGDFNAKSTIWGSEIIDELGSCFMEFFTDNHLCSLNSTNCTTFEARQAKTAIDISVSSWNLEPLCCNWVCHENRSNMDDEIQISNGDYFIGSDHNAITFELCIDSFKNLPHSNIHQVWNFPKSNEETSKWTQFERLLSQRLHPLIQHVQALEEDDINEREIERQTKRLTRIITQSAQDIFGLKTIRSEMKSWWTYSLQRLRQQTRRAERYWKRNGKREQDRRVYRQLQTRLTRLIREEKGKSKQKLVESMSKEQIRRLYSKFNRYRSQPIVCFPELKHSYNPTRIGKTDQEKSDILVETFAHPPENEHESKSHGERVEGSLSRCRKDKDLHFNTMFFNNPITRNEITNVTKELDSFKAMGPDMIHNAFLKRGGDSLHRAMQVLFNLCFQCGYFPKAWKLQQIIPIPKPNRDMSESKNYRPISLVSCLGKVLDKILTKRLMHYVHTKQLISSDQAGFQWEHSTYELLLRITEDIYSNFEHNNVTHAAFLDINKAYDSVWREGLRYKLRHYFNIKGNLYWILSSFLDCRVGYVLLNGKQSKTIDFPMGIPQGGSLSPILFLLFINDVNAEKQDGIEMGTFADDISLWTSPSCDNSHQHQVTQLEALQRTITRIQTWCAKWRMTLAVEKTQFMILHHHTKRNVYKQALRLKTNESEKETSIEAQKKVKYLGVYLDSHMTWEYHVDYIYGKAMKKVGYLKYLCGRHFGPGLAEYLLLYTSIVRPTLDYGAPFYCDAISTCYEKKLDQVQRNALRFIYRAMKTESLSKLEVISNIEPLGLRRQRHLIDLYHRSYQRHEADPHHNLSKAWTRYLSCGPNRRYMLNKRSTLTRASKIEQEYDIPRPNTFSERRTPENPQNIRRQRPKPKSVPREWQNKPSNWKPTDHDILASLDGNDQVVIFTDGSTHPNPGYGGCGVIISSMTLDEQPQCLEFSILKITTNVEAEVLAIKHALIYLQEHEEQMENENKTRIIILSDNKFAVNAITGEWSGGVYQQQIHECHNIIDSLKVKPEIYWIKGHNNIPGNELADKHAKQAMNQSRDLLLRQEQHAKIMSRMSNPCKRVKMTDTFEQRWIKHWNHPANVDQSVHTKQLLPSSDRSLFHLMSSLHRDDMRLHYRLLADRCRLNKYLFKIKQSDTDLCLYCQDAEDLEIDNKEGETNWDVYQVDDVEHFLLHCPAWTLQREEMKQEMMNIMDMNQHELSLQLVLTGKPLENFKSRLKVISTCLKFVKATKRQI